VGDKEVENGQVALRCRGGENPGPLSIAAFIEDAKESIREKR